MDHSADPELSTVNRRQFVTRAALALSAAGGVMAAAHPGAASAQEAKKAPAKHNFKLRYAPHFNMFKASAGDDPVDQLKWAADRGFTAWEDNQMMKREVAEQERIAKAMSDLGIAMGVFVATGNAGATEPTFTVKNEDIWKGVLDEIKASVDVARRVNATWMTVVPGAYDLKLDWNYQTANCIELLKRCSEILEPHNLVMVLEPLNHHTNHPTMFLHESPQSYQICRAVGSPACKTLFDIYHQQITEGNLIPNIEMGWEEIGYFQAGDNPGRKEPGTGEINYRNIFKYIHERSQKEGRDFIIGMEHGNSMKGEEGEEAVVQAYVEADAFQTS